MRHADKLDAEYANLNHVPRFNAMQKGVAEQVMFFKLALGESGREVRTVNRNVEFLQNVGQRAEVVLVAMSEHDGRDAIAVLFQEVEIRYADVDAIGCLFRKAHARVEDDHVILVTHCHAIHSKLADAAERNDL